MALFYDSRNSSQDSSVGDSHLVLSCNSFEYIQNLDIDHLKGKEARLGDIFESSKGPIETSFSIPLLGSFNIKLSELEHCYCTSVRVTVSTKTDNRYTYQLKSILLDASHKEIDTASPSIAEWPTDGQFVWAWNFRSSSYHVPHPLKIVFRLSLTPTDPSFGFFPALEHLLRTNQKLADLLMSSDTADISFSINGKRFFAHQPVLTKKSSVFATMFSSQMKEATSKEVVIEDSTFEAFYEFIRYFYTEVVHEKTFDAHWADLLNLGEKYDVAGLKRMSSDYLMRKLTIDNCLELYTAADRYSLDDLKQKIFTYIKTNAKQVTASSQWGEFSKEMPKIAMDLAVRIIQLS